MSDPKHAIRQGSKVHAAIVTETGAVLGSTCRFKGSFTGTTIDQRAYVLLDDGAVRAFPIRHMHHADNCPRRVE